jgi:cyclophilin family peptidyl-prolyl cis-trans isomerase
VSKADKRERQKENRERAREERERLQKRERQMKTFRSLLIVLVPIMVILIVVSLTSGGDDNAKAGTIKRSYASAPPMTIDQNADYTATMETSEGTITLALDAKTAPVATNNFVFLARNRFYDGLVFHRAAKDFVIQGGDPKGDGSGGPGYSVTGEVPTDNYPLGALAAAKTGTDPAGSFGSQFFIVTGKGGATLPNDYARFGTVTKGLEVAQKIQSFAPASGDGVPTKKVTITKVTIQVGGKTLPPSTVAKNASTTTTTAPATTTTTAAAAATTTTT